jgi:hypothetical protein
VVLGKNGDDQLDELFEKRKIQRVGDKSKTRKTESRNIETLAEYMDRYNENVYLCYLLVVRRSRSLSMVLEFDVKPFEKRTAYCIQHYFLYWKLFQG